MRKERLLSEIDFCLNSVDIFPIKSILTNIVSLINELYELCDMKTVMPYSDVNNTNQQSSPISMSNSVGTTKSNVFDPNQSGTVFINEDKEKIVRSITDELFDEECVNEINVEIEPKNENQIKMTVEMMRVWSDAQEMRIIFDSDIDDCLNNSSLFLQKVLGKSNLYFVVEDSNGNIFGGYVCEKINGHGFGNNENIFVFSLNSLGDKKGYSFPRKFGLIEKNDGAYYIGTHEDNTLFSFGAGKYDIHVNKNYSFNSNWCIQRSFDYKRSGALCDSPHFKVSRIFVIESF